MNGKLLGDLETVYMGARGAGMVFLEGGGYDCFNTVKFCDMQDQISDLKKALGGLMLEYEVPASDRLKN